MNRAQIAMTLAGVLAGLAAGANIERGSYTAATLIIVGWLAFFGVFLVQGRRHQPVA